MQTLAPEQTTFVDRRQTGASHAGVERRQFSPSYDSNRPEVNELAQAVDQYKLMHRRRFITFEELYDLIVALGYHR
jgi:hypothetical protein